MLRAVTGDQDHVSSQSQDSKGFQGGGVGGLPNVNLKRSGGSGGAVSPLDRPSAW